MLSMPGLSELLIIFGALLLIFGAKKLPGLGKALGESISNFKKGMKETTDNDKEASLLEEKATADNESSESRDKN